MAMKWISACKGVRYREHETRKHNKRPDKYYTLQYKRNGKVYNEPIGWASEGVTQARCEKALAELKENWRTGTGGQTLAECRERALEAQATEKAQKVHDKSLTLSVIFIDYLTAQTEKKEKSITAEKQLMKNHIIPFFQDTSIKEINSRMLDEFLNHLRAKKSERTGKDLSPASIRYIIASLRQVWNYAKTRNIIESDFPLRAKQPNQDNRRTEFLTREQADKLLTALKARSQNVHDMALISLYCGLRQGEIFKLQWCDINIEQETLYIKDRKNKESGIAYMPPLVKEMLEARYSNQAKSDFIFCNTNNTTKTYISKTFSRVVDELGFNDGIEDRRQRIVFHSLRHTYASWLAQKGVSMFELAELLGHKDITMTQRYSHHNPQKLRQSAMLIQDNTEPQQANIIEFEEFQQKAN